MDYTKFDSIANISDGETVHASIYVQSLEMPSVEMFLSGFIGYNDEEDVLLSLYMPNLNAPIYVTPHRIKVGETIFPIMRDIRKANESETVELNFKNRIGFLESDKDGIGYYRNFVNGRSSAVLTVSKLNKISQKKFGMDCFESKDNAILYHTMESNYILQWDDRIYVSCDFLCLCRYTNPVTGNMTYNLFEPDKLIFTSKMVQE